MATESCPACSSTDVQGVELHGAHANGIVLYWECRSCGDRFHANPPGSRLRKMAAVRIGKE